MIALSCGVHVMMSWSNLILPIVLCDIKIEKVKFEKKIVILPLLNNYLHKIPTCSQYSQPL